MDLMSQFNQVTEPMFEVQRFMDFYGIEVDSFEKQEPKSILDNFRYILKFSIPEFEECDGTETRPQLSHDEIKKNFKENFNKVMKYMWQLQDDSWDDELLEECVQCITYMCRIRKGETWTIRQRMDKAIELEASIQASREKFKQQTEYDEV